jgi:hypothetical protein
VNNCGKINEVTSQKIHTLAHMLFMKKITKDKQFQTLLNRPYQDDGAAAGFTQRARERAQQYKPPHVRLLLS